MDNNGWIKIHRKLLEWEWADEPDMVALWIHLLLNANFEETKWHGMSIPRGAFLTTQSELCHKTGLSRRSLRTCLDRLKSTNEVTIETTKLYSIITICKYDSYQLAKDAPRPSERPTGDQRPTNDRPTILIEEDKELKEEEEYFDGLKIDIKRYGEDWEKLIRQWMYYKYASGNPYKTQASVNLMVKQLTDLSGGDFETALKIIEQSMANNWAGLFALKDQPTTNDNYKGDSTLGNEFERKM
jgi:hypothetical protein